MFEKYHRKIKKRVDCFMKRRSHRSFRLTKRRDYVRNLELPGYIKFTKSVFATIWKYKKIFVLLALFYAFLNIIMVGLASEEAYSTLRDTLNATGTGIFVGAWGEVGKAGLMFLSSVTGGISGNLTEAQQIYAVIITLMTWLTCVWSLRNLLAGHKVRLRDGIYGSGGPIAATFIISIVLLIQFLPLALAIIGISTASASGWLGTGVQAMMFWVAAFSLGVLSFYWATSTLFALVIVTIPGMYPFAAIKAAGDLVVGRRLRILYRFIWMGILVAVFWTIIMVPLIIFDGWVKGVWPTINWLPTIPITMLILGSLTVIFASSYIYLLYRKVVDSE